MRESFHSIDVLLREAPAFQALSVGRCYEVATDLAVIARFSRAGAGAAARGQGGSRAAQGRRGPVAAVLVKEIDFPEFVRALVKGTFQAVVDASRQQMEAYAALLASVARSVDLLRPDAETRAQVVVQLERELRVIFADERGPSEEG